MATLKTIYLLPRLVSIEEMTDYIWKNHASIKKNNAKYYNELHTIINGEHDFALAVNTPEFGKMLNITSFEDLLARYHLHVISVHMANKILDKDETSILLDQLNSLRSSEESVSNEDIYPFDIILEC